MFINLPLTVFKSIDSATKRSLRSVPNVNNEYEPLD